MLVSIVTPTLNQARFIGATLDSVAAQSYATLEHLVIDGGSTDGTQALLAEREMNDARLSWLSEPDDGMYAAVNKGLQATHGEILAYLNSDDALTPWALEVAVGAFEKDRELGLVYGDALRFYEELGAYDLMLQAPFHFAITGRTGSLVQPAVFWRRSLVEAIGLFDERLRLSADLDYWLRASRATKLAHVDEILAVERAHVGGQTARVTARLRAEATEVRGRYHADRWLRRPLKLLARIVLEALVRGQMLRYLWSSAAHRVSWSRFRTVAAPRIRRLAFAVAMVTPRPLVGTPQDSILMRLLRGRWLQLRRPIVGGFEVKPERPTP